MKWKGSLSEYVFGQVNLRPTLFAGSAGRGLTGQSIGGSKLPDSGQLSAENLFEYGEKRITHLWEAQIALCGGRRVGHI